MSGTPDPDSPGMYGLMRFLSLPRRAAVAIGVPLLVGVLATAGAPGLIRVRSGDTLSEIAARHDTTVAELQRLNALQGTMIYAGRTLKVPGAKGATATLVKADARHRVVRGDTLIGIAKRYGVSTKAIAGRNELPASLVVQLGQTLVIPGAVRASTSSTSPVTPRSGVSASAAAHRAELARREMPSRAYVRSLIRKTAKRHGVDPALALAVAYHESGFQQRVVSPVDAIGVMQVLPSTGRWIGRAFVGRKLDLLKVEDNVLAGVLLLRSLVRGTDTEAMALAGYYQGLGSVARKGLLPQTHQYIRNINALKPRFR